MSSIPAEARAVALLLVAAFLSALLVSAFTSSPAFPSASALATPTSVPVHVARGRSILPGPLTGQPTGRALALRRPIAVIVGNLYPSARPQAGLARASVVFEAPVEGGITRLMPIFLEKDSQDVGPIRSARPYFVKWAAGFKALLVHAGGSPAALRLISATHTLGNIEALRPLPEFNRDAQRLAPDNLFGGTPGFRSLAARSGQSSDSGLIGWSHAGSIRPAFRGHIRHIHVDFSTAQIASPPAYSVDYRFDPRRDLYSRSEGGVPAIDRAANRPLTAENVLVLYTSVRLIPNDPQARVAIATVGSGRLLLFHDGGMQRGRWQKASETAPLQFFNRSGGPLKLKAGNTWIEVTSPGDATESRS